MDIKLFLGVTDQLFPVTSKERHTLGVKLYTPAVFEQKVDYIHNNPVKAGLCRYPEEYVYSSAKYYLNAVDEYNFLSHYNG